MIEIITTILGGPIGQLLTHEASLLLEQGIKKVKQSLGKEAEDPITIESEEAIILKAEHGLADLGKRTI